MEKMHNGQVRVNCEDVGTVGKERLENFLRFCRGRPQSKPSRPSWINCQPSLIQPQPDDKALVIMKAQRGYEL